jgi:hypothetical protein
VAKARQGLKVVVVTSVAAIRTQVVPALAGVDQAPAEAVLLVAGAEAQVAAVADAVLVAVVHQAEAAVAAVAEEDNLFDPNTIKYSAPRYSYGVVLFLKAAQSLIYP